MRLVTIVLIAASLAAVPMSAAPTPQGGSNPPTVHVGGDIKPPVKVKGAAPTYPPLARQGHVEGVVIIEVTIGTDGKVKDTKVIRTVKMLEDSAVSAVRTWEYKPTIVNGQAVQVVTTVPINFTLE
jgi:periplasmic protein TonB